MQSCHISRRTCLVFRFELGRTICSSKDPVLAMLLHALACASEYSLSRSKWQPGFEALKRKVRNEELEEFFRSLQQRIEELSLSSQDSKKLWCIQCILTAIILTNNSNVAHIDPTVAQSMHRGEIPWGKLVRRSGLEIAQQSDRSKRFPVLSLWLYRRIWQRLEGRCHRWALANTDRAVLAVLKFCGTSAAPSAAPSLLWQVDKALDEVAFFHEVSQQPQILHFLSDARWLCCVELFVCKVRQEPKKIAT